MSSEEPVYDPTELQLRALDGLGMENLKLSDLAKPQIVQILIQQQVVLLTELKARKNELTTLRSANEDLRDEREGLRVKLATSNERANITWIEIPISILSGFAINMLTTDPGSGLGWVLLVISIMILAFLRVSQISPVLGRLLKGGQSNAQD